MSDLLKREEIADKVASYISESKGLPENERIELDTSLVKSGLVDSLSMEELIVFLERTFSIHIDVEDMIPDNFETLAAIVSFIERKMAEINK